MIGNRSARQIAGQILERVFRAALTMRRAFDENVPVALNDFTEPGIEFSWIVQPGPFVLQFQLARRYQPTKTVCKLLAKDTSQFDVVGQERFFSVPLRRMPSHDPLAAAESGTATGDDRVKVGMEAQLLVSRVQDHQGRRLKLSLLPQRRFQRAPGTAKQQIIKRLSVA